MCCQAAGDTVTAIDRLEKLLAEAKTYLQDRNDMAAWGTLLCFDEASEDLKAAIRLHSFAFGRRPLTRMLGLYQYGQRSGASVLDAALLR
jgi:hypothetical protein